MKNGVAMYEGWNGTGSFNQGATTSDDLVILDVSDADEGSYQLVITTSCGSISTNSVTLTVTGTCPPCPIDMAPQPVGDGHIDVDDLLAVINQWGNCTPPCQPQCPADVAPVGGNCMINVDDLLAVINAWVLAREYSCALRRKRHCGAHNDARHDVPLLARGRLVRLKTLVGKVRAPI